MAFFVSFGVLLFGLLCCWYYVRDKKWRRPILHVRASLKRGLSSLALAAVMGIAVSRWNTLSNWTVNLMKSQGAPIAVGFMAILLGAIAVEIKREYGEEYGRGEVIVGGITAGFAASHIVSQETFFVGVAAILASIYVVVRGLEHEAASKLKQELLSMYSGVPLKDSLASSHPAPRTTLEP